MGAPLNAFVGGYPEVAQNAEISSLQSQIATLTAQRDELRDALKDVLSLLNERDFAAGRCQICGWVLRSKMEDGCTAESCSYRPSDRSEEWRSLDRRRKWLKARAALSEATKEEQNV